MELGSAIGLDLGMELGSVLLWFEVRSELRLEVG